jgi:hypothetical protein
MYGTIPADLRFTPIIDPKTKTEDDRRWSLVENGRLATYYISFFQEMMKMMIRLLPSLMLLFSSVSGVAAFSTGCCSHTTSTCLYAEKVSTTRRSWLEKSARSILLGSAFASSSPQLAYAKKTGTDASSLDPDLPPDAIKSYLQYRYSLQLAADFYIFDLQNMVADTGEISFPFFCHNLLFR